MLGSLFSLDGPCRACKLTKSRRRIIKKCRLDRFEIEDVRANYQRAIEEEVKGFLKALGRK